ncbi:hypothetical protein M0K88_004709, partial [Escherichia coli]|nr:conjugal transfer protein TrbH [Escherichia coli]
NMTETTAEANQALAADTAKQLVAVYPPALTRLNVDQETNDAYGQALIKWLRLKGYAVQEMHVDPAASFFKKLGSPSTALTPKGTRELKLRYLVDVSPSDQLYRVTVQVGTQSLTRAYLSQDNTVRPAGTWTRKE